MASVLFVSHSNFVYNQNYILWVKFYFVFAQEGDIFTVYFLAKWHGQSIAVLTLCLEMPMHRCYLKEFTLKKPNFCAEWMGFNLKSP